MIRCAPPPQISNQLNEWLWWLFSELDGKGKPPFPPSSDSMAAPSPKPPTPRRRGHHQHPPSSTFTRRLHVARCFPDPPPPPPASTPPNPNPNPVLSLLSAVPDWADAIQERRIRDRRPLYDHAAWREHRSSRRHLRHLLTSLSSRAILSLAPPVSAFTAFAAAIATYNTLLPAYALTASSLPYQLTAPALALLLVFRTEASYARFDEGRKAWMRVLAGAADLAGMVMHHPNNLHTRPGPGGRHADDHDDDPLRRALINYILAFPVALKCHIIFDSDVKGDLQGLLAEDDLNVVLASKHRPRCIIEFISQSLQMLDLDEQKRSIMESKLSCFLEGIGVCEQLMGIPIPLSYTRLTSRFLVLWHLTLPVILWEECKWIVVPATFISAASLFCIEEVGVLIEEPFPMLALDALCKQLHDGIKDVMAVQNSVHSRLVAKTTKDHRGSRCENNGRPSSKREEAKID
ncbi:unnamed protein product [Miscanthus lutarioriparius]|uniref:Uncharacterized protein n=1 Tax=Miscanthus lutarioriparius TaxID=422564 RepID=A0A811MAE2_9POAL|nr:unnamed protein product [Miscanthus lutarioriparius]